MRVKTPSLIVWLLFKYNIYGNFFAEITEKILNIKSEHLSNLQH